MKTGSCPRLAEARKHGLLGAVMIGLGSAIGFEIFVLLDYAYFLANTGLVFALFLCGLISLLTMFSYSELGAALPVVGGEYSYTKAAFGGFIAFMSGCLRWLSSVFGAALAAIVFVRQLSYLFSAVFPAVQTILSTNANIVAMGLVFILGVLGVRGAKKITALIVGVFLAIFVLFLVSGSLFTRPVSGVFPGFKALPGVLAATAYTFSMFVGVRATVAGAPEIREPEKNVPKAIFLSTVLLIALYCGVAYVTVNVAAVEESVETPLLNFVADKIMDWPGGVLFAVAGMVASISSLSTALTVQSSIVRGMSRDGYLPKILLRVHRRFGTPHVALLVNLLFVMFFSLVGAVEFLGYAASFASILVFAVVNLSVMRLRERKPHLERPFKAPFYPVTPILGVAMSLLLLGFPVVLRDVNAENAIIWSLGLMTLVLTTYHLRMVGLRRLRVALGGISLGTGLFIMLLAYLVLNGFKPLFVPLLHPYILVFVGVVSVVAGVLNILSGSHKLF
jgi:amino acid transporter